jgi:hypothetical protein
VRLAFGAGDAAGQDAPKGVRPHQGDIILITCVNNDLDLKFY